MDGEEEEAHSEGGEVMGGVDGLHGDSFARV